ncbi:MAG: hypothetical protein ACFE96_17710 [Candidatus Hermodarchaeota archaeon]
MSHKKHEFDWENVEWGFIDDDMDEDWVCDDWKGENMLMYPNLEELIDSHGPYELQYWRALFRSFLARSTVKPEACEVSDSIMVLKIKGNSFIYVKDPLLDLCVLALVRKIYEKDRYCFLSYDSSYDLERIEKLFRLELEVYNSKSFKLLCCELKQWVDSGYRTRLPNPKLEIAILNQLNRK